MRTEWIKAYRRARVLNRDVNRETKHDPSRRALSVMDAARKVGRPFSSTNNGHAAAWLRIAGDVRRLGDLAGAREIVAQARRVRSEGRYA